MSRKTRKLMWSVPLIAAVAVIGALAAFMTLTPGGASAQDGMLGPPTGLTAVADGQTKIKLSWTAPSGGVFSYRIDVAKDKDGEVWEALEAAGSADITITGAIGKYTDDSTGLKAGTTRHYRVFAIDSRNNEGEPSQAVSGTTAAATQPGVPSVVLTVTNSDGISESLGTYSPDTQAPETASTIEFRWGWVATGANASPTGGSAITAFEIQRSKTGSGGWVTLKTLSLSDSALHAITATGGTPDTAGYAYQDKNLTANTTWHYRVRAINKVGPGGWSSGTSGTTDNSSIPGSPTNLIALGTDSRVVLYWIAPSDPAGAPVTGYKIQRRPSDEENEDQWVEWVDNTRSRDTTFLAGGPIHAPATGGGEPVRWDYRVFAINDIGTGTDNSVEEISAGLPSGNPVGSPKAEATGRTSIKVSWIAPVGSTPTNYTVLRSRNGTTWESDVATGSSTPSYAHTGLNPEETWYYLVYPGAAGTPTGGISQRVHTTTAQPVPPGSPTLAAPVVAANKVTLTITSPAVTGNAKVTGYQIRRSLNQIAWETIEANYKLGVDADTGTQGHQTNYDDKGLTAGTTYYYQVSAVNSAGVGTAASTMGTTTSATSVSFPTGLVAVARPNHNVDLYWLTPVDPLGAPVTGYWIQVSQDGGKNWSNVVSDTMSRATTATHSGAPAGTTLLYRVYAIGADGAPGPVSIAEEVTTPAATAPEAPTVSATADSATQITVSWTVPYHGGSPITGYVLQKMMGMDYMTIAATDAATWWNTLGCPAMNAAVPADSTPAPGSDDPNADPRSPYCYMYGGLAADAKMVVDATFDANYDTITGMSYEDMGLTASTEYSYRVAAMNAVDKGEYGMAKATTTAPASPAETTPPTGVMVSPLLNSITVNWTPNSAQHTGTIKVVLYNQSVTAFAVGVAEPVKSFNLAAATGDPGTHTFNNVPAGTYRVGVAVLDSDGMHKVHLVAEPVMITAGQ